MLRSLPPALAYDRPYGDRHLGTAPGHETPRRHPIDDLIDRIKHEVEALMDEDRAHPGACRTGCQRAEPRFRNRRIKYPLCTELRHEPSRRAENSRRTVRADAKNEYFGIKLERLPQGRVNRLRKVQTCAGHSQLPCPVLIWLIPECQNGPGRTSSWSPANSEASSVVNFCTIGEYSFDQLLATSFAKSAGLALLAVSIAA